MNFDLTEEQRLLKDSVTRFVDDNYALEERQKHAATKTGFSEDNWRKMAELGWLGVTLPVDEGGFGGTQIDTMLIMEEFGRGLVVEPYLANITLSGGILKRAATPPQKERWLMPLIAGELQAALAFAEPQGRYDIGNIATTAARKRFVLPTIQADNTPPPLPPVTYS